MMCDMIDQFHHLLLYYVEFIFITDYTGEITAGIAGGVFLILIIVSLVLYRNWRYEQELDSLLWKIDFRDVQMHDNDKESTAAHTQKQTRVIYQQLT